MKMKIAKQLVIALVLGISNAAVAQEATPTATPTATPNPKGVACPAVQSCVAEQVPQTVQACFTADPSCTLKEPLRFALTATELATRAIEARKCTDPLFLQSKIQCNACYRAAKRPLSVRAAGVLFKGLIGQSVKIVEQKRVEACSSLSNTLPKRK